MSASLALPHDAQRSGIVGGAASRGASAGIAVSARPSAAPRFGADHDLGRPARRRLDPFGQQEDAATRPAGEKRTET